VAEDEARSVALSAISYQLSLLQKSWIAPCSAGLPTGVDRVEGSQNAHQEMGATKRASFETVDVGIFARG
jgi:hypothetical protein